MRGLVHIAFATPRCFSCLLVSDTVSTTVCRCIAVGLSRVAASTLVSRAKAELKWNSFVIFMAIVRTAFPVGKVESCRIPFSSRRSKPVAPSCSPAPRRPASATEHLRQTSEFMPDCFGVRLKRIRDRSRSVADELRISCCRNRTCLSSVGLVQTSSECQAVSRFVSAAKLAQSSHVVIHVCHRDARSGAGQIYGSDRQSHTGLSMDEDIFNLHSDL